MMRLTDGLPEKSYLVEAVEGGCIAKDRLWKLGIIPGVVLTIKRKAPMRGPLMIEVNGVDIVVGRGIANRIIIREAG
ncbi:FeoA family protein [Hippea alviniae]|uniref:FeoA family protein n=1 Tax=Hippea alviniae TaxID=1279027 RepID=UPI00138B01CA|nr:FeoA domain-containing protein [Hippea alviniae]